MVATRLYMRFPEERAKALTLSYDDHSEQDIRFIEILNRNGIKGTFNISTGLHAPEGKVYKPGTLCRRLTRQAVINLYKNSGHEVSVHGYSHPNLTHLPAAAVTQEIYLDRIHLEADFETDVRGMAYPFGDCSYSEEVAGALRACGIVYARMTSPTRNFRFPDDWLRWYPTCKHTDEKLMKLAEEFVTGDASREPMLFYLWGHSFEFERDDNWQVIENFCAYMGQRKDIWYATNIEIYDYVQAYQRLIWTADLSRVTNPSAMPVSFLYHTVEERGENKRNVTVGAGETLRLR